MDKMYEVAGHVFKLSLDEQSPLWGHLTNYEPFETSPVSEPLFSLDLAGAAPEGSYELIPDPEVEKGETVIKVFKGASGWMFGMAVCDDFPICGRLYTSEDFKTGHLLPLSKSGRELLFAVNNSLMLQYAFCTAGLDTLEMHSSVVKCDGRGYLSLGHSGAGKSTHSKQWLQYVEGSTLLNDDNPIVRVIDGVPYVFGSPWSGKTPCYINDSCPAAAFMKIVQDQENVISRMDILDAYAMLYSSCSGLRFDEPSSDGLHATLEKVVSAVPCWELRCRADKEAAMVCSAAVKTN